MYSYGPPHMAGQKQDDQLEHTFSSYMRTWDVALKTYRRWWTIGRSSERGSGISVLAAWHDDDDDDNTKYISFPSLHFSTYILSDSFNFLSHIYIYIKSNWEHGVTILSFSPSIFIVHHFWSVLLTASSVCIELMYCKSLMFSQHWRVHVFIKKRH